MTQHSPSILTRHWQNHFFCISAMFLASSSCLLIITTKQYAISFILGFLTHYVPCWIAAQCTFLYTGAPHKGQIVRWFFCGEILKLLTYSVFALISLRFFDINIYVFFAGLVLSIGTFLWVPPLIEQLKSK